MKNFTTAAPKTKTVFFSQSKQNMTLNFTAVIDEVTHLKKCSTMNR